MKEKIKTEPVIVFIDQKKKIKKIQAICKKLDIPFFSVDEDS